MPSEMARRPLARMLAFLACLPLSGCAAADAQPADARRSSAGAVGPIIYTADAEKSFPEEWNGYTAASPDRFTRVAFPKAQGSFAWRVDLLDGDPAYVDGDPSYGNFPERAQQNALYPHQRFNDGEERYIAFQVYLPDSYPLNDVHRQTIMQIKRGCNGPPVSLEAASGAWRVVTQRDNVCGNSSAITRNVIAASKGRFARFTFRIKFSPNPAVGYLEVFANNGDGVWRTLQPLTHTATMKQTDGVASPPGVILGYYRWAGQKGNSYIVHDGLTVATTRAAAEASAFGPDAPRGPEPSDVRAVRPPDTDAPRLKVSRRAVTFRRGVVRVALRCPTSEPVLNGTVAVRPRGSRRPPRPRRFSCSPRRVVVVKLRLSSLSRSSTASARRVRARIIVVARDGAGNARTTTIVVQLRAR